MKVSGGILQLTLGIALVVASLSSALILLAYYSQMSQVEHTIVKRLNDNCSSGLAYFMANRSELRFNEPLRVDLFGDGADSIEICRRPWGLFEIASIRAWNGRFTKYKFALVTAVPRAEGLVTLYLPENHSPIYMVGEATVKGPVLISERKFSTGYVNGRDFQRKTLYDGDPGVSETTIPKLDTLLISALESVNDDSNSQFYTARLSERSMGTFSFEQTTDRYVSDQSIDLEDTLRGNVIVQSEIGIRVFGRAAIENAILIAPRIAIDDGFEGTLQCFATKYITVGKSAHLHYPSSLSLTTGQSDSTITIRTDARVEGLVLIRGLDQLTPGTGKFKIEKGGFFRGTAFVNGRSECAGSLIGNLITRSLEASAGFETYANHLIDGSLENEKDFADVPGSLSWANGQKLVVAKWL